MFKKRMTTVRKVGEYESPCWYDDQASFMQELESPRHISPPYYACKQELELQYNINIPHDAFLQLPQLESPKVSQSATIPNYNNNNNNNNGYDHRNNSNVNSITTMHCSLYGSIGNDQATVLEDQVTDWRVLDKFVASQLSQDQHASKENAYNSNVAVVAQQIAMMANESARPELEQEYASTSTTTTTSQIDLWK